MWLIRAEELVDRAVRERPSWPAGLLLLVGAPGLLGKHCSGLWCAAKRSPPLRGSRRSGIGLRIGPQGVAVIAPP